MFKRIVVTGPESCGKTSLARALAHHYATSYVPELARYYVGNIGRPYLSTDLAVMLRGQQAWENWYAARQNPVLICDTDWTVFHIWEQELIRTGQAFQSTIQPAGKSDSLYLLCAPDLPWAPDPLREHRDDRERLFELYYQLLTTCDMPFSIIRGAGSQRLQAALAAIQKTPP